MNPKGIVPPIPVGMFDSGIGGFTVLKELRIHASHVPFVYFGDTFHVPYGGRPLEQIRAFAKNAIGFLTEIGVAAIAVACNVSSSVLTRRDIVESEVPVFGLIAGGAQHAVNLSRNGKIGVLATSATVKSASYQREILLRNPDSEVIAVPCPKFVPLVEAGERKTNAVYEACKEYLAPVMNAGCDTVIYGCTHYPFLSEALSDVSGGGITFVDPAAYLALEVIEYLQSLSDEEQAKYNPSAQSRIFLSEMSEVLVRSGGEYLGFDISPIVNVANINEAISKNWEKSNE